MQLYLINSVHLYCLREDVRGNHGREKTLPYITRLFSLMFLKQRSV